MDDYEEIIANACVEEDIEKLDSIMHEIIENGDLDEELLAFIIEELQMSAEEGQETVARKLLEFDDVKRNAAANDNLAFENAVNNKHLEIAEVLISSEKVKTAELVKLNVLLTQKNNAKEIIKHLELFKKNTTLFDFVRGTNLLHKAIALGRNDIVRQFVLDDDRVFLKIINDKNKSNKTPLDLAVTNDNEDAIDILVNGYSDLIEEACKDENIEDLNILLESLFKYEDIKARVINSDFELLIDEAAANGRTKVLETLLQFDGVKKILQQNDNLTLIAAVKEGKSEVVESLSENVHARDLAAKQLVYMMNGNEEYDMRSDDELHIQDERKLYSIIKYANAFKEQGPKVIYSNSMNLLHMAILTNRIDVLEALLKDKDGPYAKAIQKQDRYGRTPLDLAIQMRNTQAVDIISKIPGIDLQAAQEKSKHIFNLSQTHVNKQLTDYLTLQGRDAHRIVDPMGNCNGWGFMHQFFVTAGRENEFYDILKFISRWDGTLGTLKSELPESIKKNYQNAEELFEQVITGLTLFMHTADAVKELELDGWGQYSRIEQYNLIKDPSQGRELRNLFNISSRNVTREQLIEMLQLASRWRDISLDVTGGSHATSLYITADGIFKYFDSNNELKAPDFSSAEELADYIIETKYKNLGKLRADDTFEINLNAYKFYNVKPENIPSIEPPLVALPYTHDDDSPNGFTELHYAVMENNIEKVSQIIKSNPESVFEVNVHGNNALHLAVYNNNKKMINILLATDLDVNKVNNNQDTALHIAIDWGYDNSLAALLKEKKTDLNKSDSLGRTPLVMAIENRDRSSIQLLLDHGAVIDKKALKAAKKINIVDKFIKQYISAKDAKPSMLNAFRDQRSHSKASFTIENSNKVDTQASLSKVKPKS